MTNLPGPDYWPVPVDDVRVAFPGSVTELMPAEEDIPSPFWDRNEWTEVIDSFFHRGIPAEIKFLLRPGVDGETMFRHLRCVLGSYEPKHQYKLAAASFLLSRWCTKIEDWKSDA